MKLTRRSLLAVTALGMLVSPVVARAQPAKLKSMGVLVGSASAPGTSVEPWLAELGYREGDDIAFENRFAAGRDDRLPELAADLVRRKVDVILAMGLPAVRAAKQATRTIPIVMIVESDPVKMGLVASIARPGGVTGVTALVPELSGKRLEILKEAVPGLKKVAVLWNPDDPEKGEEWKETEAAARILSVALQSAPVRKRADLETAFDAAAKARSDAVLVLADALIVGQARSLAALARNKRLPAMYLASYFVDPGQGGFISYGPNFVELSRRAAAHVDRILKGAKPAELPVEQPTRLELVINLRAAKALGLTLPPSVLVRADRMID